MTSGRSQVLATSNFRDWHTVVGEIHWKTTMDCHSKLVLHSLGNNQPVHVIVHQPRQTTLFKPLGTTTDVCQSDMRVNVASSVHRLRESTLQHTTVEFSSSQCVDDEND